MTQHKTERKNNGRTAVIVALLLALVTFCALEDTPSPST